MTEKEFITLAELGLELSIPKSSLAYWKNKGLITPSQTISKTDIYKYTEVLERVKRIMELQKKGLSLISIKTKLDK